MPSPYPHSSLSLHPHFLFLILVIIILSSCVWRVMIAVTGAIYDLYMVYLQCFYCSFCPSSLSRSLLDPFPFATDLSPYFLLSIFYFVLCPFHYSNESCRMMFKVLEIFILTCTMIVLVWFPINNVEMFPFSPQPYLSHFDFDDYHLFFVRSFLKNFSVYPRCSINHYKSPFPFLARS